MLLDIALLLIALASAVRGYRSGFLATIFRTVGYLAGGVAGLYLALQFITNITSLPQQILILLVSIFLGAQIGLFIFGKLAKFFHSRILWKPLKAIDSLAGVALELIKVTVISYLVLLILLWAPVSQLKSQISDSQIYAQLNTHLPKLLTDLKISEVLNLRP
jgi:uncharacterized membrane protein required for colicin V production